MNFSDALTCLKQGRKVFRNEWDGKDRFLQLVDSDWINCSCIDDYEVASFIAIKTAYDRITPWVPSQVDLLAEDWEVDQ